MEPLSLNRPGAEWPGKSGVEKSVVEHLLETSDGRRGGGWLNSFWIAALILQLQNYMVGSVISLQLHVFF